jgi:hypothetical protein
MRSMAKMVSSEERNPAEREPLAFPGPEGCIPSGKVKAKKKTFTGW